MINTRTGINVGDPWRLVPHLYAWEASGGKWHPYPYLKIISEAIANAVIDGNGRLIVEVPPRHGKSELISHWTPVWFLDQFPEKSVILTTYEADFAAHWGRQVRNEIQYNPKVRTEVVADSSARSRWETTDGGGMITAGIGGAITGRGGHLILVDDPVKNWAEATSVTYRRRAIEWFQSTLLTRAEPDATVILLMTRWHKEDLAGWLQSESEEKWKVLRFPAISNNKALCPERFPLKKLLEKKKAVGSHVWNSLYQQKPVKSGGNMVKRSWWKFYAIQPTAFEEVIMSVDASFKETTSGSYVVMQIWGRIGADRFLLDQTRARMDFPATIQGLRALALKWPAAQAKLVEDKANGPAIISTLKHEIPGIIAVKPDQSKEARLSAVMPQIEAGNVHLPDPSIAPWIGDYLTEFDDFPKGAHDDQVDSTVYALLRFAEQESTIPEFELVSMTKTSLWR